jgi:hypothetical protein
MSISKLVKDTKLMEPMNVNSDDNDDEFTKLSHEIEDFCSAMCKFSLGDIGFTESFWYMDTPLGIKWTEYQNSTIEDVLRLHKQHIINIFELE